MKTFKPETVEKVLWFSADEKSHLLVKARGRGWFVDTRNVETDKPPSKKTILACLTDEDESNFKPCRAKELEL